MNLEINESGEFVESKAATTAQPSGFEEFAEFADFGESTKKSRSFKEPAEPVESAENNYNGWDHQKMIIKINEMRNNKLFYKKISESTKLPTKAQLHKLSEAELTEVLYEIEAGISQNGSSMADFVIKAVPYMSSLYESTIAKFTGMNVTGLGKAISENEDLKLQIHELMWKYGSINAMPVELRIAMTIAITTTKVITMNSLQTNAAFIAQNTPSVDEIKKTRSSKSSGSKSTKSKAISLTEEELNC